MTSIIGLILDAISNVCARRRSDFEFGISTIVSTVVVNLNNHAHNCKMLPTDAARVSTINIFDAAIKNLNGCIEKQISAMMPKLSNQIEGHRSRTTESIVHL